MPLPINAHPSVHIKWQFKSEPKKMKPKCKSSTLNRKRSLKEIGKREKSKIAYFTMLANLTELPTQAYSMHRCTSEKRPP